MKKFQFATELSINRSIIHPPFNILSDGLIIDFFDINCWVFFLIESNILFWKNVYNKKIRPKFTYFF